MSEEKKGDGEFNEFQALKESKGAERVITGAVRKVSLDKYGEPPQSSRNAHHRKHKKKSRDRKENNRPSLSWRNRGESESSLLTPSLRPWRPTPKWSKKDLLLVAKMDPVDAFLEVMDNTKMFRGSTLEVNKPHEIVIHLIVILGKVHQVPLAGHLQSLARVIFGSDVTLRDDILAYVKYAVELEEKYRLNLLPFADQVWSSLESFCRFGRRFSGGRNCWAFFTRAICGILENRQRNSLMEKFSLFSRLKADYENAYFYPESIYATVEDTRKPQTLVAPVMEKGKMDAKEYLNFQFSYLKSSFYLDLLYNNMQKFSKLEEEKKSELFVKLDNAHIFPRVRILQPPPMTKLNLKHFLVDLAPHGRIDGELPKDIEDGLKTFIKGREFVGCIIFLSTSSTFENIINAFVPTFSEEILDKGYLMVDIVQMENVKECIFNKDLFLFFNDVVFQSKIHTLKALKKMSTATLPMKEYLVDCEASAILPDYENLEEHDWSLEKVDLRTEEATEEQLKRLEMNERQFQAFKMALTRKLTLIQGPPGTGKTTVALNIIRRLLANTSLRILIVSFANINLDRFIFKCSTLTDEIIRIGMNIKRYKTVLMKYSFTLRPKQDPRDPRFHRLKQDRFHQVREAKNIVVETVEYLQDESENSSKTAEEVVKDFQEAQSNMDELYSVDMYQECQKARLIGMTSSGVAKYHEILEIIRPSVVIIVEASVIPESHIITSLTEHTQQLILIGDHTQFTHMHQFPFSVNCPETMLVQRLIENDINNVLLNVQHRMHPDISDLLRDTLYPDLVDGENVKLLKPIRGIPKNLFCVSDENLKSLPQETLERLQVDYPVEDNSILEGLSHEMLFCAALANYLRLQGYQSNEIVILTPFEDYENLVDDALKPFPLLEDVDVLSMDSFQNLERRIVILSLSVYHEEVLSHFLEYDYRIRVLLSRAKEGFYIVGPIDFYAEKSELWKKIRDKLEAKDAIGPGLPIKCEKHGEEVMVSGLEDFLKISFQCCTP